MSDEEQAMLFNMAFPVREKAYEKLRESATDLTNPTLIDLRDRVLQDVDDEQFYMECESLVQYFGAFHGLLPDVFVPAEQLPGYDAAQLSKHGRAILHAQEYMDGPIAEHGIPEQGYDGAQLSKQGGAIVQAREYVDGPFAENGVQVNHKVIEVKERRHIDEVIQSHRDNVAVKKDIGFEENAQSALDLQSAIRCKIIQNHVASSIPPVPKRGGNLNGNKPSGAKLAALRRRVFGDFRNVDALQKCETHREELQQKLQSCDEKVTSFREQNSTLQAELAAITGIQKKDASVQVSPESTNQGIQTDSGPRMVDQEAQADAGPRMVDQEAQADAGPRMVNQEAQADAGPRMVDQEAQDDFEERIQEAEREANEAKNSKDLIQQDPEARIEARRKVVQAEEKVQSIRRDREAHEVHEQQAIQIQKHLPDRKNVEEANDVKEAEAKSKQNGTVVVLFRTPRRIQNTGKHSVSRSKTKQNG